MYSLIIVDYNSIAATMDYIDRCRQHLGAAGASHVVIVENGKEEGVAEALAERFGDSCTKLLPDLDRTVCCYKKDAQEIIYCASGGNLGYARGNNLGAEIAKAIWHDPFYIISNNDLEFSEALDFSKIDTLFSESPQIGVIGPLVFTPAGEQQSPRRWTSASRRLVVSYWISGLGSLFGEKRRLQLWNKHCNDTVTDAPSGYCDWVSGCFFFVRAEAFHKAGMFDEHTFLYAEEMILAKHYDCIEAMKERIGFFQKYYPSAVASAQAEYLELCLHFIYQSRGNDQWGDLRTDMIRSVRQPVSKEIFRCLSRKTRLKRSLLCVNEALYIRIIDLYIKRKRR